MSLRQLQKEWKDTPEHHQLVHESFCALTNADPRLKAHRDWVEQNVFGFGERSFHWMWKLIVDELPQDFAFMEIGVFRGQVLSLVELLAARMGKRAERVAVTPLSSVDGHWESNYAADIARIHIQFGLSGKFALVQALSTDREAIKCSRRIARDLGGFDVLYIDGGHAYETARSDILHYLPLVKAGGLLVIDDSASSLHMPFGYFQGIADVSRATDELLPPATPSREWEFLFSVVHNRVWRRKE